MNLFDNKKLGIRLILLIFLYSIALSAIAVQGSTGKAELEYYDKQLNLIYRKIYSKLSPDDQRKFKISQREWINFRDKDCTWAFTAVPLECLIDRTDNRIQELSETVFFDSKGNYSTIEK